VRPGQPCPVCERPIEVVPHTEAPDLDAARAALAHAREERASAETLLADARAAAARGAERVLSTETERQRSAEALADARAGLSNALPIELRGREDWRAGLQQAVASAEQEAAHTTAALREAQRALQAVTAALSEVRAEQAGLERTQAGRHRSIDELTAR